MARFDRPADGQPICVVVSFRRWDAGWDPLFADTLATPGDYRVDDARVGVCAIELEQANGTLDPAAPRVEHMTGSIEFATVIQDIPIAWSGSGTLVVFGTEYSFRTLAGGEGLTNACRGP